jgi:hypothetical protein
MLIHLISTSAPSAKGPDSGKRIETYRGHPMRKRGTYVEPGSSTFGDNTRAIALSLQKAVFNIPSFAGLKGRTGLVMQKHEDFVAKLKEFKSIESPGPGSSGSLWITQNLKTLKKLEREAPPKAKLMLAEIQKNVKSIMKGKDPYS